MLWQGRVARMPSKAQTLSYWSNLAKAFLQLGHSGKMPYCRTLAHAAAADWANHKLTFQGVDFRAFPPDAVKAKWTAFATPVAGQSRRYRGLILRNRSHTDPYRQCCVGEG